MATDAIQPNNPNYRNDPNKYEEPNPYTYIKLHIYMIGPSKSPHPPKGFHRAGEIVKSTTDKSIVTTNNFDPAGGTVQSHPPTRRMSAYVHACDVFVDGNF